MSDVNDAEEVAIWTFSRADAEAAKWQVEEDGARDWDPSLQFEEEEGILSEPSIFERATLTLASDGTWALRTDAGADSLGEYYEASGTWTRTDERLQMEVDPDMPYEDVTSVRENGDRLTLGLKIDFNRLQNHELGQWTLRFDRGAPAPRPDSLVGRICAADHEPEVNHAVGKALKADGADATQAALWDAIASRSIPTKTLERPWLLCAALDDHRLAEAEGFTHAHALACLPWIEPRHDLGLRLQKLLPKLPVKPEADRQIAEALRARPAWVESIARAQVTYTFDERFESERFPQPELDEASRVVALTGRPRVFPALERIFASDDAGLARAVVRYRGRELHSRPMALFRERGITSEARAAALELLSKRENMKGDGIWMGAVALAADLSVELNDALPEALLKALEERPRFSQGALNDDEKASLRERLSGVEHGPRVLTYLYVD